MSLPHPAVTALPLSGLAIFWLTPISAWWMLRRQRDQNARLCFTGTSLYAVVATLLVLGTGLPAWLKGPLGSALSSASMLFLFEALRREVSSKPAPYRVFTALWLGELALLIVLQAFGGGASTGVAVHLVIISLIDVGVILMANRARMQHQSRALWLVMCMLAVFVLSNVSRVLEWAWTGRFSSLMDFTLLSSFALF